MPSGIGFGDIIQDSTRYSVRTVTDVSVGGLAVSGLPAINVFDSSLATLWARSDLDTGDQAILRVNLVRANMGKLAIGVIALLNVRCEITSTGLPSACTLTLKIGTTAGGSDIYTRTVRVDSDNASTTNNYYFAFGYEHDQGFESDTNLERRANGGDAAAFDSTSSQYMDIVFSGFDSTKRNVAIGRIAAMPMMFCKTSYNGVSGGIDDPSTVQRAYSGTVYALRRNSSTLISANIIDLKNREVFGGLLVRPGFSDTTWRCSLRAINRQSGTSSEVIYLPWIEARETEQNDLYDFQQMCDAGVWGYLDQPISYQMKGKIEEDEMLWQAGFSVRESVP